MPSAPSSVAAVQFSHVHMYCDRLRPLDEYKQLERKLNAFAKKVGASPDVSAGRAAWLALSEELGCPVTGAPEPAAWKASGQDVVEQLLVGLGWRITGTCSTPETTSFVVTSPDPKGVQFVVTAHNRHTMGELAKQEVSSASGVKRPRTEVDTKTQVFGTESLVRFGVHQAGREGIAVLGFKVSPGGVAAIHAKYTELHPELLVSKEPPQTCGGAQVLEVFAYYKGEQQASGADRGTLIRFVELVDGGQDIWVLPGVETIEAAFDGISLPAYCDHWVSNVVSRTGFLDTLHDTLGFTPKVDFNAGVVAAGEAQIESTVTGNDPGVQLGTPQMALFDQSQVYLPINNALSEVGHVHLYLKEIGQGVQHIASRVADLPALVQRANDLRKMTGAGFSFLSIPRSYYGTLTAKKLSTDAGLEVDVADKCVEALRAAKVVDDKDIVDMDVSREAVIKALPPGTAESVADSVLRARYGNLYSLLRDHIAPETYMKIVRNNILVDIQGEDMLMQIFTANVLQRTAGEEAPFLEFIQRICSECVDPKTCQPKPIKPGCGGFGIRNFLTLFLSIEVTKAAKARADAASAGHAEAESYYNKMVDAFTAQLDESNPILTAISDAMTAEGAALEAGAAAGAAQHAGEKAKWQEALQGVSTKYKDFMRALRENAPAGCK